MTTKTITAEFAIEQLKILCQDGDVSTTFPDFENSSDDDDDGVSEDCIADFVGILAESHWESAEEFFKFYKFLGYELFITATDPELHDPDNLWGYPKLTSPHGIKFSTLTLTFSGGYFDLYVRGRKFVYQDPKNEKEKPVYEYANEKVEIPSQCDAGYDYVSVVDLIPATAAYIWDHGERFASGADAWNVRGEDVREPKIEFLLSVINYFGNGFMESSRHYYELREQGLIDIGWHLKNPFILECLFYCNEGAYLDTYVYENCIKYLLDNESTTSKILKTIALASTGNYEKLAAEFEEDEIWEDEDCFVQFRDYVMEEADWDVEEILEKIESHNNCTDEILEIIAQYDPDKVDDEEEDD
jgi:hypothetical protein